MIFATKKDINRAVTGLVTCRKKKKVNEAQLMHAVKNN